MRRFAAITVGILAAGLLTVGTASAESKPSHVSTGRPLYLALGDSVAAGTGASDSAVTGYVPRFYELLRQELSCQRSGRPGCRSLALRNVAVGGATTSTLIDAQLPLAVEELRARNGDRNPQNDVKVVTIDIGGNDLFSAVPTCLPSPTPQCTEFIHRSLLSFAFNFAQILAALRAAAGPDTIIIAMTYYNPLPHCQLAALTPLAEAALETPEIGLNELIRSISAANGVLVADTYGKLSGDQLVGGSDCLHPNDAGHQAIADLFASALTGAGL